METRDARVDQRMLAPQDDGAGGAGQAERYRMQPLEVFRMPVPTQAPDPVLPQDSPRAALAPTTVCLTVVLTAGGSVLRSAVLDGREECRAGAQAGNADLLLAAQAAVAHWQFVPAAICHFDAEMPPRDQDSCEGAARIEPVPVSLQYAFTFEVVHGQVRVSTGSAAGR